MADVRLAGSHPIVKIYELVSSKVRRRGVNRLGTSMQPRCSKEDNSRSEVGKGVEFRGEEVHPRCNYLRQVKHCSDLPLQVASLAHIQPERIGQGLG